jgi:protein involved in polysaccharide export with SLBB domain
MNIKYLGSLITFIIFSMCQPSLAQSLNSLETQLLLLENPSLIESLTSSTQNSNSQERSLTSNSQDVANSGDRELQLNLNTSDNQSKVNAQSLSARYYKALSGQQLNTYGSGEFNSPQDDGLLFFNTIGNDYQLAPGDIIQVIVTGITSSDGEYQVLNDGNVTIKNIYPINVDNMTLDEVGILIRDKILLDDASAEVFVRLKSARLVTVQISGNVKSPRTIAVPAYTPISRVIAYSGGISDNGSLRNVILSQIGQTNQKIDFYDFLQNPSPSADPLIKNGARIFVPNKGSTIAVSGFVNNPGIYELTDDKPEMKINDLLKLTGSSFFPSGATLKISYFDINGQIKTRMALINDFIKEGEALQVDFIETRDLNVSKVYGAVLKNYEIKSNTSLSIKEVLKDGAVLGSNAHYQFALIIGKDVQAININDALADENIILPTGHDLLIFTKKEYLNLVAENPNKSFNPIATKLAKAKNIAEIYLDGIRIAYVPVNQNHTFSETIKNFYIPGPKTIFDIALIENNSVIEAVDLKTEIGNQGSQRLENGDRLFIFEDKFYDTLLKEIIFDEQLENTLIPPTSSESVEVLLLQ